MGLCGSAPPPPDPYATADAQTKANTNAAVTQAALNRIDQYSPFGSTTYTIKGYNADGTPQYVENTQLNPLLQSVLESQLQQDQKITGLGGTLIDQANANISNPLTAGSTMPLIGGMSPEQFNAWTNAFKTTAGPAQQADTALAGSTGYGSRDAAFMSAGQSLGAQGAGSGGGSSSAQQARGWDIQKALQGAGDLQGQFNSARDAALQSQMGYLQPQFDQQSQQARNDLRQQGITQESNPAAYQHAMDQINREQTFQRQQAFDSSFQTGLASANQLFNQSLQAGQFANTAQQQGFDQSAWNAGQQNQVGMANAANQTQAGIASAANATQANIASMQAANALQQFNAGQFNAQQQFNAAQQNAARQFGAGAYNAAALQNAQMANQIGLANAGMLNQQGQFNTEANNAAQQAAMQGYLQNAGLQNNASAQQLQQLFSLRNQPLNELASLRGLTPIQSPQPGPTAQSSINPVDITGLVNNQYQGQLGSYNNQQQGYASMASSAALAAAMIF